MIKKLIFIMLFGLSIIVLGTFSIGCSVDKYSKGSCSEGDLQLRFSEKQALLCTKTIESKLVFIRDRNHTFNYEWSYARADIDAKTMKKFLIELGLGNFTYKVFYIRLFFPHRKITKGNNLNLTEVTGFMVYYIDENNKAFAKIFNKNLEVIGNYHVKLISSADGAYVMYDLLKVPLNQGTVVSLNGTADFNNESIIWRSNYSKLYQNARDKYYRMRN